jgi:anti-sigma B factor antagonist
VQGTEMRSGNPVLFLSGEIDMASAEGVTASLRPLIEAGGPVIIDVSKVTFMDSTGLHVLLEAAKALGERGCIIVHGADGAVAKVIEIVGLAQTRENLHVIECTVLVRLAA